MACTVHAALSSNSPHKERSTHGDRVCKVLSALKANVLMLFIF